MKFISTFDFLGTSVRLNIGGYNSNKTYFGGLLSIIVIALLLLGSSYFMYLLVSRTNYSVISSEEYYPNSFSNWTNPELSLYLTNGRGEFLQEADRLYSITGAFWYYQKIKNPDGSFVTKMNFNELKMEKCILTRHFPTRVEMWKDTKFLSDSYCVAPNQNANLTKPFSYDDSTFVSFWVHRCWNTTTKNDCYPRDYIDKTLANSFLLSRFTNYYFDHSRQTEPAVPYINIDGFTVSSTVYKNLRYYLSQVEYFTDDGIFLPQLSLQNYSIATEYKESMDFKTVTTIPETFAVVSFNMNVLKKVITRRYYKFQNMLADLGGLLKGCISIAVIINWYFCNKQYYNEIINASINSLLDKKHSFNTSASINKKSGIIPSSSVNNNCTKKSDQPKSSVNSMKITSKIEEEPIELENFSEKETVKNYPRNSQANFTKNEMQEEPVDLELSPKGERKYSKYSIITSNTERFTLNKLDKMDKSEKSSPSFNSKLFSDKNYRKSKFFLSFSEYLFPLCCFGKNSPRNRKLRIHYKYRAIILKQFDVLNILPKLHDVDKISYIITGKNYMYGIQNSTNPYLKGRISENSDIMELRKIILKNLISIEEEKNEKL